MITLSVCGQKGGIAKTTSSVSIGGALVLAGFRVLLCDLDAQASATLWLTNDYGEQGRTVRDVLRRRVKIVDCIRSTDSGMDVVPSNLWLSSIDLEMIADLNKEQRLPTALGQVEDRYDFTIIDCPPSLGLATVNALTACDTAIIPVDCRSQALLAVPQLLEVLANIGAEYNRSIGVYALPTFFERTNLAREILAQIEEQFESATLPAIHKNTRLAEAFVARKTIFQFDPTAIGAVDYRRAAKEIADDLAPRPRTEGRARRAT